jgi:MinD-like ATPase involved in chromosome partitioning or flagellar assembly
LFSDYRIDKLQKTKNTVTLLQFLGIEPEKIAVVMVDPEGKTPNLTTANVKPYVEDNLGITLVEVISFDAKTYQLFYLESQPIIQSNPKQKLAQDLKHIAQYITTYNYTREESKQPKKERPPLEVKK